MLTLQEQVVQKIGDLSEDNLRFLLDMIEQDIIINWEKHYKRCRLGDCIVLNRHLLLFITSSLMIKVLGNSFQIFHN